MLRRHFFFAIVIGIADGDIAGGRVNSEFGWVLEGGTFLDEVITDQAKFTALGKNRGLILQGSVLEVIDQASRDPVAMDGLQKVAIGEMLAVEGT